MSVAGVSGASQFCASVSLGKMLRHVNSIDFTNL